jgi:two-component system, sensor histidine kinase and response regulator
MISEPRLPSAQDSLILVVDDMPQNIQVVAAVLYEAGYSIMPATSASVALQRVARRPPDLILLDFMMPEVSGPEVCRQLKANPGTREIPIIFLTASNEMEHLVQALEAGAVDYVTKPFNATELLARIRTHLELKHSRDVIIRYSQELSRLNQEKNEFMGIVAHDLRSPLTAIKGYAEMMIEEPDLPPRERGEFARKISETSGRMSEMVRNLLDANAIERGEMKFQLACCELAPILRGVVDSFLPRAAAKQQVLQLEICPEPLQALVDGNVLIQILENLVSNAIKYSPGGKQIHARLLLIGDKASFEVEDEGPGISLEDQQRLFSKFGRLSTRPTGGELATGLGLSIVKRMVEAMQGKVWCETAPGRGAKFVVEFATAG